MAERVSVHVLRHGRVLCGSLHGLPCSWGPGLRWVGVNDAWALEQVTCPVCRLVLAVLLGVKIDG